MKIHEYQAKEILQEVRRAGPEGQPAFSIDEAEAAAKALIAETGSEFVVVKAQIHAGGRGKGGGVKVVKGAAAAPRDGAEDPGHDPGHPPDRPGGQIVKRLLVEQGVDIARELYLGLVVDRGAGRVVVMASSEGGMEIEEVAANIPEKILKEAVDPVVGLAAFQARNLAYGLGLTAPPPRTRPSCPARSIRPSSRPTRRWWRSTRWSCCKDSQVLALDAKITFDDNALYRQQDLEELRDLDEEDPAEIEAKSYDLSFIKLDGNIGCMVNGAGLAMATMDIIKHFGGQPANFLDVGGGATEEQ